LKQEIAVGLNKETADLLRDMASKLGTTAEHLWGVLVKQAPIAGASMLSWGIPIIGGWILWGIWNSRIPRFIHENHEGQRYAEDDSIWVPFVIFSILLGFLTFAWLFQLPTIASCFFNPEYWALKQIWKG
jgi:hypothetical protein